VSSTILQKSDDGKGFVFGNLNLQAVGTNRQHSGQYLIAAIHTVGSIDWMLGTTLN
jgi:hypothetical protein